MPNRAMNNVSLLVLNEVHRAEQQQHPSVSANCAHTSRVALSLGTRADTTQNKQSVSYCYWNVYYSSPFNANSIAIISFAPEAAAPTDAHLASPILSLIHCVQQQHFHRISASTGECTMRREGREWGLVNQRLTNWWQTHSLSSEWRREGEKGCSKVMCIIIVFCAVAAVLSTCQVFVCLFVCARTPVTSYQLEYSRRPINWSTDSWRPEHTDRHRINP